MRYLTKELTDFIHISFQDHFHLYLVYNIQDDTSRNSRKNNNNRDKCSNY